MTDEHAPSGEAPQVVDGFEALGFFTADHAAVADGKVYANGAYWTALNFPAFPAVLPVCAIVAVLRVPWHAHHHDHTFAVQLVDSDGARLPLDVEGNFRGAPSIEMKYGEPGTMPVAIPLFGLTFERPGDYSFVLRVDADEIARYPFRVRQVAIAGPGLQPPRPMGPADF